LNLRNLFAELKRRHVYKVTIAYGVVAWLLMQIATLHGSLNSCVLVRLDHIAHSILKNFFTAVAYVFDTWAGPALCLGAAISLQPCFQITLQP